MEFLTRFVQKYKYALIALFTFALGVAFLAGYQRGLTEALVTFSNTSSAMSDTVRAQTDELKRIDGTLNRIENVLKTVPAESSAWVPNRTRSIAEIRKDMYGSNSTKKILITYHEGGKVLPYREMEKTVRAVFQRLPNIRTTDELVALVMETMIVETHLGGEKWETGIRKWKNYGIGQFVMSTATSTVKWLKDVRPDVHEAVMAFYNKKHDMAWNLCMNIPFSIAMIVEYYWRVCPDIYANIGDIHIRSKLYKRVYNSPAGLGSPEIYRNRVRNFMKTLEKAEANSKKTTRS